MNSPRVARSLTYATIEPVKLLTPRITLPRVKKGSKSSLHTVSAIQESMPVLSPYLSTRLNASEKQDLDAEVMAEMRIAALQAQVEDIWHEFAAQRTKAQRLEDEKTALNSKVHRLAAGVKQRDIDLKKRDEKIVVMKRKLEELQGRLNGCLDLWK